MHDYQEPVSDEQVISLIQSGIMNSVGDWLNSADIARERQKSTYEYGMMAEGHLLPQGVSQIVSSDTVEVVEGYLAILSELLMNNNKLAKFREQLLRTHIQSPNSYSDTLLKFSDYLAAETCSASCRFSQ